MKKTHIQLDISKEDFKKKLDIKDGKTPVAGVDFELPKDGRDGKDGRTPIAGIDFDLPENGKKGDKGDPGKDGSPDTPVEIVSKLSSLSGTERLSYGVLKDVPEYRPPASRNYSFLELTDTPKTYTAGYNLQVNAGGTGIDFVVPPTIPPATTPAGTDKMLQFNDGGVFGGAVEIYWNKTEKKMKMLTGSTFELYNTADITTNYERATLKYTSNQLQLTSEAGGTGTARGLLMILPNGAVTIGSSTTANTNKTGRFFIPHYNTSEEAGFVFGGTITSTSYLLDIGGGSSSGNTITQGRLWAASNNTTLTGTQIATWDVSRFIHNSGINYKVTRISSATHNVTSNEHLLYVDYTVTGAVTINLPSFASTRDGQEYVIADTGGNASVNNITITPAGSNTIGLAGSKVISTNGGSVTIKGDNSKTNWIITSNV